MKYPLFTKFPQLLSVFSLLLVIDSGSFLSAATAAEEGHDEHEEEGVIVLTPQQIQNAGIELAQAGPASIRTTLPLYGVVATNLERVQNVSARFPGVIRGVNRKLGDHVQAGDSLVTIESNEALKDYTLSASIAGVITERNAIVGEQTGDKTLFVISDLSSVWVELSLFPRDRPKVSVGQTVRIQQPQTLVSTEGELIYLSTFANSANQTLSARVLIDNPDSQWVPGQFVNAEITLETAAVNLAVRNEAIQTLEGGSVVFVLDADGFEPRQVQLGRTDSTFTEIVDGLDAGASYVVKNSFILKSELGKEGAEHGH